MQPETSNRTGRREPTQPVNVLQLDDALLKIQTVCAVTGLSASTIRRGVVDGSFPKPVKRGTRCTRWVSRDVSAWLKAQKVAV